jgi:hypothetical protein
VAYERVKPTYIHVKGVFLRADGFTVAYRGVKVNTGASNSVLTNLFIISIETQIHRGLTRFLWITAGTFPYKAPWSPFLTSRFNTLAFAIKKLFIVFVYVLSSKHRPV